MITKMLKMMQITTVNRIVPFMAVVILLFLTSCNANEIVYKATHGSEAVSDIAHGGTVDPQGAIAEEKQYIDQKTGQTITAAQNEWNNRSDRFKLYGLYIAMFSFVFGFLIRRLVRSSAFLRRLGLIMEIAIPFFYVLFAYLLAMFADKI